MRDLGMRLLVIILIIVGYFFLLRPVRGIVNEVAFKPAIAKVVQAQPALSFAGNASSVSNHILVEGDSGIDQLYLTVPFGLHFLVACIGLAAMKAERKFLGYLVLIQVATGLLSLVFLVLTNLISIEFISFADFTVKYLNPLCSLGLVPLAFTLKKQTVNES